MQLQRCYEWMWGVLDGCQATGMRLLRRSKRLLGHQYVFF